VIAKEGWVIQETFLNYRRFRWLWITVGALALALLVYCVDSPPGGRNGGTVIGYAYGTVATVAIVWLMAYGLRKRAYASSLGTVEGWLAAHVWIGIGLLLLVPLHAGFSFGFNVHTLAYVCMVGTILSGIWGVANYATLAGKITAHRGGAKDITLGEQIYALTQQMDRLCASKSEQFLALFNRFDFSFTPGLRSLLKLTELPVVDHGVAGQIIGEIKPDEKEDAITLLGLMDHRADLARTLLEQARIKALLRIWLYVHVPVSVALCVSLAIHIFSVFFFW
jgi:hypothetical protein